MERTELPTGTVTFLFSDMEGSTRLTRELGEATFADALEQHQRLLRSAFVAHAGIERGTEGDSFMVVFPDAIAAVSAAADAQISMAAAAWPANARVRVRMGIHTGAGVRGGDDYVGIDVHKAARIAAAGHGGQVLLSDATRGLVAHSLPDGIRVQALGSYRLKDLPGAEPLYQLEIRGLASAFPPLRALDVRRAHLPPEATSFIGRAGELEAVAALLAERRLVTLTGPGGTGKTRLALRCAADVADRFVDGAFFVPLAAIDDRILVPAAVAATLNLPDDPNRRVDDVLGDWLSDREVLLVLDNLEQIEAAGTAIDDLLSAGPGLRILATSRSPLRIGGEQEFPVPPFRAPTNGADVVALRASDAVRLFTDRARLVRPDFAPGVDDLLLIADISNHVDGLPLAIELAAARIRTLPLAAIRDRLGRRLDALVGGPANAPSRQRSLRATIAWSHDLLDDGGRAVFRRLASFVGGWTLEGADAVAGQPPALGTEGTLDRLVEQSLVQVSAPAGEPRFTMLPTIGEYATERLEASDESMVIATRHASFFLGLAQRAKGEFETPAGDVWLDRIELDLDNMRVAIERSVASGHVGTAMGIAAALRSFWLRRNRGAEGLRTLTALVEQAGGTQTPEFAAAASAATAIATWLGDYAVGRRLGALAVDAFRIVGDRPGLADALGGLAFSMIEVDPRAALTLNLESSEIYRELGDVRGQGQGFLARATAQFALGRLQEVRESLERSIALSHKAGDLYFEIFSRLFIGRVMLLMGEMSDGVAEYRTVLSTSQKLDLRLGIAAGLDYVGEVAIWNGDASAAVRFGAAAARIKEELGGGIPPRMGGALDPLEVGRNELSPMEFERQLVSGRSAAIDATVADALAMPAPTRIPPAPAPPAPSGDHI